VTPPETPEDTPSDSSDQSYERVFAELFHRFWRSARTDTPPEPNGPDATIED
jgi:hypothetical protein